MRSKELAKGVDSVIFALSGKFKISLSDAKFIGGEYSNESRNIIY